MEMRAAGRCAREARRALRPESRLPQTRTSPEIAQEFIDLSKPGAVRGTARVQLSTPTISMPLTSVSQVTAKVQVRAHYTPDPGTVKLRQPIHGEVRVTFSAEPKPWGGKRVLDVKPVEGDDKVVFLPAAGSGLTDSDTALITQEIRRAVKNNFEPINVELPADLKVGRFKRLGSGVEAAIALPIDLPGGSPAPGPSAIDDVNLYFLKSGDHFAVAVSKEYIESKLQSLKAQIDNFQTTITVEVWLPIGFLVLPFDFDYHVTVSSPILTWQNGSIKLTVNGSATATDPAPDYSFTIEQLLTLTLNTATQKISLQAVGDASISGLPDVAVDPALDAVRQQRDAAIDAAQPAINAITGGVDIDAALDSFNAGATSRLTAVDVTPAGLIVRGAITVRPRIPAVVEFAETGDGTAFTALKTWIPAGTIERYEWAFEKENPFFFVDGHHLEGTILSDIVEDNHGFIVPIPDTLRPHGQVCLTVHGTQIGAPAGTTTTIIAGHCRAGWIFQALVPGGWGSTAVVPSLADGGARRSRGKRDRGSRQRVRTGPDAPARCERAGVFCRCAVGETVGGVRGCARAEDAPRPPGRPDCRIAGRVAAREARRHLSEARVTSTGSAGLDDDHRGLRIGVEQDVRRHDEARDLSHGCARPVRLAARRTGGRGSHRGSVEGTRRGRRALAIAAPAAEDPARRSRSRCPLRIRAWRAHRLAQACGPRRRVELLEVVVRSLHRGARPSAAPPGSCRQAPGDRGDQRWRRPGVCRGDSPHAPSDVDPGVRSRAEDRGALRCELLADDGVD